MRFASIAIASVPLFQLGAAIPLGHASPDSVAKRDLPFLSIVTTLQSEVTSAISGISDLSSASAVSSALSSIQSSLSTTLLDLNINLPSTGGLLRREPVEDLDLEKRHRDDVVADVDVNAHVDAKIGGGHIHKRHRSDVDVDVHAHVDAGVHIGRRDPCYHKVEMGYEFDDEPLSIPSIAYVEGSKSSHYLSSKYNKKNKGNKLSKFLGGAPFLADTGIGNGNLIMRRDDPTSQVGEALTGVITELSTLIDGLDGGVLANTAVGTELSQVDTSLTELLAGLDISLTGVTQLVDSLLGGNGVAIPSQLGSITSLLGGLTSGGGSGLLSGLLSAL